MKAILMKYMVCPSCKGEMNVQTGEREKDEVKEGELLCASCHGEYLIKDFIPRFVDTDKYVDSFSFADIELFQENNDSSLGQICMRGKKL